MREGIYILRLSGRLVLHLSTYIHRSLYSQVLNTHQATLLFFTLLRPSQTPSASQQPTPPSPPYHVLHPPDRTGHHTGRRLPRNAAPADRARRARRPGGTAPCPRLHPRHRARRPARTPRRRHRAWRARRSGCVAAAPMPAAAPRRAVAAATRRRTPVPRMSGRAAGRTGSTPPSGALARRTRRTTGCLAEVRSCSLRPVPLNFYHGRDDTGPALS